MDFKKYWFGHSIVWIGILYSTSECASAKAAVPFTPVISPELDTVSQPVSQIGSQTDSQTDSPTEEHSSFASYREGDRAPVQHLTPTAIATPELLPTPLEQSKAVSWLEKDAGITKQSVDDPLENTESPVNDRVDGADETSETEQEEEQNSVSTDAIDPELGDLRLQEAESSGLTDPELGNLRLQEAELTEPTDPELGNLRLRDTAPVVTQEQDTDTVFLLGRLDYFRSDNILLDSIDPIDDQIARAGVTLLAVPELGPQTQLIASVGGNLSRYIDLSELDYNDLQFRLGIRQELFPRTYGEISWRNQQFFAVDGGDRFLNDHSVRFSLSRRDQLAPRLTLDSFYQFRLSFTDPSDRSRLTNTLGVFLNYELERNLEVGLDYQVVFTDFTQRTREDTYHQVTAQLSYNLSRQSRISLFAGLSFGRSSDPEVGSDSGILGIVFDTSLSLF